MMRPFTSGTAEEGPQFPDSALWANFFKQAVASALGSQSAAQRCHQSAIGPYRVLDLLGQGGMGEVYRARDTKLNREVALKIIPDIFAADPDRLARFRREAQFLAALNHPNIGAIYGF